MYPSSQGSEVEPVHWLGLAASQVTLGQTWPVRPQVRVHLPLHLAPAQWGRHCSRENLQQSSRNLPTLFSPPYSQCSTVGINSQEGNSEGTNLEDFNTATIR